MSQFANELENLQQQQKEVLEKLQATEQDSIRYRELALKLQGAIEVLTSMNENVSNQTEATPVTPEVVAE